MLTKIETDKTDKTDKKMSEAKMNKMKYRKKFDRQEKETSFHLGEDKRRGGVFININKLYALFIMRLPIFEM